MTDRKIVVLKLGGSLINTTMELLNALNEYAVEHEIILLIIPGGGPYADTVRAHSGRLSEDTAHWMSIMAMDQYGLHITDRTKISTVEEISIIGECEPCAVVLLPYKFMRSTDPLPHTWKVTSDSIAAHIAAVVGARQFIKATDVDGMMIKGVLVEQIGAGELEQINEVTCIDRALPGILMKEKINCIVVNGRYPERIIDLLDGRAAVCTLVKGST